ncbi:MAG: cell division protein SepF [Euryarchaeota archaeon]|nr:cell division protein SepF [Euryarchaeota archaeon]
MAKKFSRILGRESHSSVDDYVELDLGQYETVLEREHGALSVRVAELASLNDLTELKREIYDGNIVLVDISGIKKDKMLLDRAVKDLKRVVADIQGDIVEIGVKEQIIVTPMNIKIDRAKIGGK